MENTTPEASNNQGRQLSRTPILLFLLAAIFFKTLEQLGTGYLLIGQLATISIYITLVLGFIFLLELLLLHSKAWSFPSRDGNKLGFVKKILRNKESLEAISNESEEEQQYKDSHTPIMQETADGENGIFSILQPTESTTPPLAQSSHNNAHTVLGIEYFFVQFLTAVIFTYKSLKIPYLRLLEQEVYSYFHVVVLLILACVFFVMNHYFLENKDSSAHKTIASFSLVFALDCLVYAGAFVFRIMFTVNITKLLILVYQGTLIYLCLAVVLSILLSAMKKELLSEFNYGILPFLGERYASQGFLDVLKEHTGISLKSLWSIRYLSAIFPSILLGFLGLLFLSTSFFVVNPHQKAAIYTLGKLEESSILGAGLHVKYPWPIGKVELHDVSRSKELQIGYESSETKDFLWSKTHDGGEYYLLLGNGNELVCVNVKLIFTISDLYAYLTHCSNPEELLSSKAYEIMMKKTVTTTLDKFLSIDRSSLSDSVKENLQSYSEELGLGLNISKVIIESIHPPVEIADVYQNVVNAQISKTTSVSKAEATAFRTIADAQLESKTKVFDAKANQTNKLSSANYEMAVYFAAYEAYKVSPESFKLDKYLKTYQKIIGNNKVYVFSPNVDADLSNYIINQGTEKNVIITP